MSAEPAPRFRIGEIPPLAQGFTERPDTAHGLADLLVPGSAVALVPNSAPAGGSPDWLGACGKTQLAAMVAESLWHSRAVDVLAWITATSRASVLSGFAQASAAATGIEPAGPAESVMTRFVSWLRETSRPWLVVLDDLPEIAHLDGLWPGRPAGPAADPQQAARHCRGLARDARHPGRAFQRPRGSQRPDRTTRREPGPAGGR